MSRRARERQIFLEVDFTPLSLDDALGRIVRRPPDSSFVYVATPNAHHMVAAHQGDPSFVEGQAGAWLLLNDSRILRLIARLLFASELPLCAGSDLVAALFTCGVGPDTVVTVIGGDAEVEARLRSRFGLRHIHRHTPPMGFYRDEIEIARCIDFVLAHPARYVFLVVGAPQSEMLAGRIAASGRASGVGLCVGSALNFLTGVQPRAPMIWRRTNLEWLYRLLQNPRKHFRRVFVQSFPILWIALKARLHRPAPIHAGK